MARGTSFALTIGSGGVDDVVGGVTRGEVGVGVEERLIVVLREAGHASAFPERSDSLRDSDAEQHDAAAAAGGSGTLRARARVVAVVSAQRTHPRHRRLFTVLVTGSNVFIEGAYERGNTLERERRREKVK